MKYSSDFYFALEQLDGIAMLERNSNANDVDTAARRKAAKAFLKIGHDAFRALLLLDKIRSNLGLIVDMAGSSAPLSVVERVFQIKPLPYDAYHPSEVRLLETIAKTSKEWSATIKDLEALSIMKPGLAESKEWSSLGGLKKAMEVCRSYFEREGIGWSVKTLDDKMVRENIKNPLVLQGKAERLVVEMLQYSGLNFTYTNIWGIWKDIGLTTWES